MKHLIFFLEEPSAKAMLEGILPKILTSDISVKYIIFSGKQDLDKNIGRRLRLWRLPDSLFIIIRDQDSGDCFDIKSGLMGKVINSGKQDFTLVRIACKELESFYLGDLEAVGKGLSIENLTKNQLKEKFRNPYVLVNASEELKKLTKYKYQKIAGSRDIGPCLKVDGSNRSKSFNVLVDGIKKITTD